MELIIIAAVSKNGVIGKGETIPWFNESGKSRVRSDMLRFRTLTLGETVIMGRTTYKTMGGALPERKNIVLSRDPAFLASDAIVARSKEEALDLLATSRAYIIGGSSIFAEFLPIASRMEITIVEEHFGGDVFFPTYNPDEWHTETTEHRAADPDRGDHFPFRFETLLRRSR